MPSTALREVSLLQMLSESNHVVKCAPSAAAHARTCAPVAAPLRSPKAASWEQRHQTNCPWSLVAFCSSVKCPCETNCGIAMTLLPLLELLAHTATTRLATLPTRFRAALQAPVRAARRGASAQQARPLPGKWLPTLVGLRCYCKSGKGKSSRIF